MPFLWITLLADSMALGFSIYAAARKPLLIDFFIVGLSMCMFAAALHQVLAGHAHIFTLYFTFVVNLALTYRLGKLWNHGRNTKH